MPGLFGHAGVKDHLEQKIAQFAFKLVHIAAVDGLRDLVGFFYRIGSDAGEGLLDVPRAALIGIPQARHDFEKFIHHRVIETHPRKGKRRGQGEGLKLDREAERAKDVGLFLKVKFFGAEHQGV